MLRPVMAATLLSCAISMAQDNTGGTPAGTQQSAPSNIERAAGMLYPPSRTAAISGRVLVTDGSAPSERIRVQRVCGVSVAQETYADSQGRFSLSLGGPAGLNVDASAGEAPRANGGGGGGRGGGNTEANLWGCELRASLRGYRSEAVPISNRHQDEAPDVGTILLHPLSNAQGMTLSATTGLAPKEAQKSYEKGLDAIRHNLPDLAQSEFTRAVGMFSRFAAAWFELGKVFEQRGHRGEARTAYAKAIAADNDFLNPFERLYLMDTRESKWQEAADGSSRVLHRDPYEFPSAYYINALANLQLQNLEAAERSAREAGRLRGDRVDPRAKYVLGLVLARQGHLPEAADNLRAFLSATPGGAEQKDAERMLANLETRMRNRAARQKQ